MKQNLKATQWFSVTNVPGLSPCSNIAVLVAYFQLRLFNLSYY